MYSFHGKSCIICGFINYKTMNDIYGSGDWLRNKLAAELNTHEQGWQISNRKFPEKGPAEKLVLR